MAIDLFNPVVIGLFYQITIKASDIHFFTIFNILCCETPVLNKS